MVRKHIPALIKRVVRERQDGGCACCLERGREFHHVLSVYAAQAEGLEFCDVTTNIVLLCEADHKLVHAVDPRTVASVCDYIYYLLHRRMPDGLDSMEVAEEVTDTLLKICREYAEAFL